MWNKLINIVLSGLLWRRYKFLIVSLLVLLLSVWVSGRIHLDYIEFAKTAEQSDFLGWSFLIKWAVWIGLFIVFFVVNNWYNKRKEKQQIIEESKSSVISQFLTKKRPASNKASGTEHVSTEHQSDPFAHLREKEKLRSYAEVIIDKHQSKQ